jgi:sigma-B regulation protein RsbU (phosphoserine phosphatase)
MIGVVDLESVRLAFFTDDHVRALTLLAPQIATSVENARLYEELAQREQRMEQDLQAAYKLQSVLMPRVISNIVGIEAGLNSRPAREISGDLYDFFEHGHEYTLIAFGDVSGKGAAAALYGALISGLLRTLAPRKLSPSELMAALNEALLERRVDAQYATLSLITWDARARTFSVVSAGTLPPMLCRAGKILDYRTEGMPIGLLEDQQYDQIQIAAEPGDLLVLYSDGVEDQLSDAPLQIDAEPDNYGRQRLEKVVTANYKLPPQRIADKIFDDIDAFRGATPLTDDQTVIALRVL